MHVGRLRDSLRAAGCEVEVFVAAAPHVGWRRALDLWDPIARRALRRRVEAFGPDVVHYHNVLNELSTSVLSLGRPSVLTVHDPRLVGIRFGPEQFESPWAPRGVVRSLKNRIARERLRRHVAATIAPSADLARRLISAGFQRVEHIENFASAPLVGPPGSDVVYVGALERHKGPQVLIDAWGVIATRHPGSSLRIVGGGSEELALRDRVTRSGIAGSVRFCGRVEPDDVVTHLGDAALVVVPSLGVEGGGPTLAVIEAMAAGRAVIVSDRPGVREGVDEAVGRIVPADDPLALGQAIDDLLADPAQLRSLGEAAARRAAERWAPEPAARRIIAVYRSVLD